MRLRSAGTRRLTFYCWLAILGWVGGLAGCAHSRQKSLDALRAATGTSHAPQSPQAVPAEPKVSVNIAESETTEPSDSNVAQASAVKLDPSRISSMFPSLKRGETPSEPGRVLFDAFDEFSSLASQDPAPAGPESANPTEAPPTEESQTAEKPASVAPSLQRLKTALSLGLLSGDGDERPTLPGEEQIRLRIENLLKRSRQFASDGEEAQARHLAQLAQKMAEESQLAFPPDAERPVDVLASLDLQAKPPANAAPPPPAPAPTPQPAVAAPPAAMPKVETPPVAAAPVEKTPPPADPVASMRANTATHVTEPAPKPVALPADPAAATAASAPSVELSPKGGRVEEPPPLTGVAAVRQRFLASPGPRPAKPAEAGSPVPPIRKLPVKTVSLPVAWPEMEGHLLTDDAATEGWESIGLVAAGLLVCGALLALIRRRRFRLARA